MIKKLIRFFRLELNASERAQLQIIYSNLI